MARVIDMWAPIFLTPEILQHIRGNFPREQLGYLRVFYGLPAHEESVSAFISGLGGGMSPERIVAAMDEAEIQRALITGFDERSISGRTFVPNALAGQIRDAYPDRFIAFAGIDILRGMPAERELEHLVRYEQFKGLSLRPFMIGLPPDDRRYYPFYAKCIELGIPISMHASANWTEVRTSDLGHPRHFDTVACDFPELKLILSHGGYPWVLEAVLLAWKHPNVYLELAAHRPKYLSQPGTGWEPLFRYGNSVIQDKVLFGTGSFLLGRSPAEIVEEFRALPIEPGTMDKWLYHNAKTVLGL